MFYRNYSIIQHHIIHQVTFTLSLIFTGNHQSKRTIDHGLSLQRLLLIVSPICMWQSFEHLLHTTTGGCRTDCLLDFLWNLSVSDFSQSEASWLLRPTGAVYLHTSPFAVMSSQVSVLMFKAFMSSLHMSLNWRFCLPPGLTPFTNKVGPWVCGHLPCVRHVQTLAFCLVSTGNTERSCALSSMAFLIIFNCLLNNYDIVESIFLVLNKFYCLTIFNCLIEFDCSFRYGFFFQIFLF